MTLTHTQRAALDEAVEKWIGEGVRHHFQLVQRLLENEVAGLRFLRKNARTENGVSAHRVIDGVTKRLKKKGRIEFVSNTWRAKVQP